MMSGIVKSYLILNPTTLVAGMIAALLATAIMELTSSLLRIPMPVTVGIVVSVATFGLITVGTAGVELGNLIKIFASWVVLPPFAAAVALVLHRVYRRAFGIDKYLPLIAATSTFILLFSTSFLLLIKNGGSELGGALAEAIGLGIAGSAAMLAYSKHVMQSPEGRGTVVKGLMVISMAALAFSHGANDVGKAAGPLTTIYYSLTSGQTPEHLTVNFLALTVSGLGIAFGIWTWGYRVVGTIGEEITTLSPLSAFTAQLSGALSVLIMTRLGMPVSTTQAIVGSVAGVGLSSGFSTVNLSTLKRILLTWLSAVPISAGLTIGIYYALITAHL